MSYQLESELDGHDDSVTCMALDANFLFSGSDDKTIRVWNLVHVNEPYQLSVIQSSHTKPVQDILIMEDTGHLVSCSFDGKIRVWDWGHEEDEVGKKNDNEDDEDHGGHRVLHEFSHPSQFRCLGYYPNQGDILVGTEEANILTFSLPSSVTGKYSVVEEEFDEGKKDERREDEEKVDEEKVEEETYFESKYNNDEIDDSGKHTPHVGQLTE